MSGRQARAPIGRERLVALATPRPVSFIEAPGGYGKTTLALQVAAPLDLVTVRVVAEPTIAIAAGLGEAFRRVGLVGLADAVDSPATLAERLAAGDRPVVVIVDEVQRCTEPDAAWLVALAERCRTGLRLLLVGRRLGRTLAAYAADLGVEIVGVDALRFDRAEAAAVVGLSGGGADEIDVATIHAATDGWPAAVALAGVRAVRSAVSSAGGDEVLAVLVGELLERMGPARAELVRRLAQLPLLSSEVAAVVGGAGALDALLDAGVPVRFRGDGWGEWSDPVRDLLLPGAELGADERRRVAGLYAASGEATLGCLLLTRAGDQPGVVDLLARMTWQQLAGLGAATLDVVLAGVGDEALAPHAGVLARAAIAVDEGDPARRSAWLARGRRLGAAGPDRRALDAEAARDLQREHRHEQADALLASVVAGAGPGEELTLGRTYLAMALGRLVREQGQGSADSLALMERAAALFRLAGERRFEAIALRSASYGIHYNAGNLDLAVEQLARAAALLPAPDTTRALCLTFVADVEREVGRLDRSEAALNESLAIGRRVGSTQAVGYAAWGHALLAAERRDATGMEQWVAEAIRSGDPWLERGAGIDFYGHFAECRLTLGDPTGALDFLHRCEERGEATGYVWPARSARARFEAVCGDPALAESVVDELDAIGPGRERPLRLLLRAVCAARRGDGARRRQLLDAALAACRTLGDPTKLERREPELLALAGAAVAVDGAPSPVTAVRLLGGFAVLRGGVEVTPPPGLPSTLVKLLALQGKAGVEEVIDRFWPEADVATGRSRLRNLLNRTRSPSGPLVERRGELLALVEPVDVDHRVFEAAAADAFAAPASARAGLARATLSRHGGELLPGDRYEEWTVSAREWTRRRVIALLDLLSDDALQRGDLDDAVHVLGTAIDLEPLDIDRYERAATVLARQGRAQGAAELAQRALAVQRDLGMPAAPALLRFVPPA